MSAAETYFGVLGVLVFMFLWLNVLPSIIFHQMDKRARRKELDSLKLETEEDYDQYLLDRLNKSYRSGFYKAIYKHRGTDITSEDRLD